MLNSILSNVQSFFTQPGIVRHRGRVWRISAALKQMLLFATVMALLTWSIGVYLRSTGVDIFIWGDQEGVFLRDPQRIQHPYRDGSYFNPPWGLVWLWPLAQLPLEIAVLLQFLVYYWAVTGVIFKFGADDTCNDIPAAPAWHKRAAVICMLTSPFALDTALEINIDWVIALGLLIPVRYSAPFLLTKPQNAIGYLLSVPWRDLIYWTIGALMTILLSFLIWGDWPLRLIESSQQVNINYGVNASPVSLIGWVPSIALGSGLLLLAVRRRDPVAGIWSGLCFVPYIALYSFLLPFGLLVLRFPRVTGLVYLGLWVTTLIVLNPL